MNLENINISKDIKNVIVEQIPQSLIKTRKGGGGKELSYIAGSTVIDLLNKAFGYCWSWEVKQQWIEKSIPYFNTYTKMPQKDQIVNPATGKKGAWEEQGPVAHVLGTLTVHVTNKNGDIISISKDGYGSKSILGKQNDQESIYKAAGTDALKKAASLLGIGLELYRDEEQQAYFDEINYEDPWTEEMQQKYSKQLTEISALSEKYNIDDETMYEYCYAATNNTSYYVLPENIDIILKYIKEQVK